MEPAFSRFHGIKSPCKISTYTVHSHWHLLCVYSFVVHYMCFRCYLLCRGDQFTLTLQTSPLGTGPLLTPSSSPVETSEETLSQLNSRKAAYSCTAWCPTGQLPIHRLRKDLGRSEKKSWPMKVHAGWSSSARQECSLLWSISRQCAVLISWR